MYILFRNTNIKSFIEHIITFNNIDDILDTYNSQSEKGFIFERLYDIIIKFGFCEIFKMHKQIFENLRI